MIDAIVASFPPSPLEGCANSIGTPLRKSPRARSKLFRYVEAVLRFDESMVAMDICENGEVQSSRCCLQNACKQWPSHYTRETAERTWRMGRLAQHVANHHSSIPFERNVHLLELLRSQYTIGTFTAGTITMSGRALYLNGTRRYLRVSIWSKTSTTFFSISKCFIGS